MPAQGKEGDARYTNSEWETLKAAGETKRLGRWVDKGTKNERYIRTDRDSSTQVPVRANHRNIDDKTGKPRYK